MINPHEFTITLEARSLRSGSGFLTWFTNLGDNEISNREAILRILAIAGMSYEEYDAMRWLAATKPASFMMGFAAAVYALKVKGVEKA